MRNCAYYLGGALVIAIAAGATPVINAATSRQATVPGGNQGMLELLEQIQDLQRELRKLRGDIEEQGHAIEQLKRSQKDLYTDLENRLRTVETGGVVPPLPTNSGDSISRSGGAEVAAAAPSTTEPAGPSSPGAQPWPEGEKEAYQAAFNLLKEGKYDQAIAGFVDFQSRFPDSDYADNAQYWIGEAYYVTRKFEPAIMEYTKLAQLYPDSPKHSHALLKIGYSHDELGQAMEAKAQLRDLVERYPETTAARLAEERLRRIRLQNP